MGTNRSRAETWTPPRYWENPDRSGGPRAGSAAYYERGRLPYAPAFAEVLATSLGLDGQDRLLDVGCGPGIVTLPMARYFREAAGVDPDPDMLAQAAR